MQSLLSRATRTRSTGLAGNHRIPWGVHICQFFQTPEDLVEVLVPYFQAGLEANEQCVWVTAEPLATGAARGALLAHLPDLPVYEARGQIEFVDFQTGYANRSGDELIEGWLDREESALRSGYEGLRVAGNLYPVERSAWDAFARYERQAASVIEGRRIIAVCSYSLDKCGAGDLLDVLNSHDSTLVRDEGGWRFIQRAGPHDAHATMPCERRAPVHEGHDVQFYDDEEFPAFGVASFLGASLQAQGAAVAVATNYHLAAVCANLVALGHDVSGAVQEGRLMLFDAEKVLGWLHVGGQLDAEQFESLIGGRVRAVNERFVRARWFGELVDMLCRQGREPDAIRLEGWWNRLRAREPFELLCAYSYSSFAQSHSVSCSASRFEDVCAAHAAVQPAGAVPASRGGDAGRALSRRRSD